MRKSHWLYKMNMRSVTMRTFQIILADDEQQILHGMERGIDWEGLGFSVAGTAQNGK